MSESNHPDQVLKGSNDMESFKAEIIKLCETPKEMLFERMRDFIAKNQVTETSANTTCIVAPKYGTQEYRDRENYKNSVAVEVCNLLSQRSLSVADGTRVLEVAIAHLVFSPVAPLDQLNDEYRPL